MDFLTLQEARDYLRVDSTFEDDLIETLLRSAQTLCRDVARLSQADWNAVCGTRSQDEDVLVVRGEVLSAQERLQVKDLLKVGTLYALGYLFEHREEADHHDLTLTLRSLLFSIREGVV